MKIPFSCFDKYYAAQKEELDGAYHRVAASNWFILGREVENFERAFAEYCGSKHCVGVANGLEAIQLILRAYNIGPGDEVIVAANTYVATWLGVSNEGATPIPVEPVAETYNLDPRKIEAAITPRTKAIFATHLYGQAAEMDSITDIGRKHGLKVFWDAAQSHGARYKGRNISSIGDATAFSYYPTKNLGALGDAGSVVTDNDGLAEKIKMLRNYGSKVRYSCEYAGCNSRLDELQAAFLSVKLPLLDSWNERRKAIASIYRERLQQATQLSLPFVPEGHDPVWHLFVVRHPKRDELLSILKQRGVETMVHYPIPPHLQNAYSYLGYKKGAFPITEAIHNRVLSLPMHPFLSDADAGSVCEEVIAGCRILGG